MQIFQGPRGGRKLVCGVAAVVALGLLASGPPASAAEAPTSGAYYQNYLVRPTFDVGAIILYEQTSEGGGVTNSFQAQAPSELITDPFLKTKPIDQTYLMGVTTLGNDAVDASEHLVLALNDAFAQTVLSGGLDFGGVFSGYDEGSLISALDLLAAADLPQDDPGRAAQAQAKDDAYSLIFGFSDSLVSEGGAFGPNSTFKLVAFSTPTDVGDGEAFSVAAPTALPEPASWALMILGFGGAGWLLRQRRDRVRFARA